MGIQPFIYGHSGAFSTHEKNEIGIFLQLFPMFNMYAARVFSPCYFKKALENLHKSVLGTQLSTALLVMCISDQIGLNIKFLLHIPYKTNR